jgi:hypothetical protein
MMLNAHSTSLKNYNVKKLKQILFVLSALIIACYAGNAIAYATGLVKISTVAPFLFSALLFGASFIPQVKGVLFTTFTPLVWDNPVDNAAGCEVIAYYAPTSDILTFPTLSLTTGELVGTLTLVAGKTFLPIYGVSGSVKVDSKLQGEAKTKSYKPTGSLTYPSWARKTTDFGRIAKNGDFVFVFIDNNGDRKIIGSPTHPAGIDKLDFTTGDKGTSGTTMQLEVSQEVCNAPAGYYSGAIPISTGTLPALT